MIAPGSRPVNRQAAKELKPHPSEGQIPRAVAERVFAAPPPHNKEADTREDRKLIGQRVGRLKIYGWHLDPRLGRRYACRCVCGRWCYQYFDQESQMDCSLQCAACDWLAEVKQKGSEASLAVICDRPRPVAIKVRKNHPVIAGHKYGQLRAIAPIARTAHRKILWCCECECGSRVRVEAKQLYEGKTVSCGCRRADPVVRQLARLKIPRERRKQIGQAAGAASVGAPRVKPYSITVAEAASMLALPASEVRSMCASGLIRAKMRKDDLGLSKGDVQALAKEFGRKAKGCDVSGGTNA